MEKLEKTQNTKSLISLRQLIATIVFLGIFFIPFSSFESIPFLGEFSREASSFFFFLAFLLIVVYTFINKKISIPFNNLLFQIVLLFLGWFLITTLINIPTINNYYFKGISGFERFIRQYSVLLISGLFFLLTYYNVFKNYNNKELFYKIRKVFLYSMIVVTSYAILEILILKFRMTFLNNIIQGFNYFPFTEVNLDFIRLRISSVTFEAPALATYLFTVAGWMFSYIITEKGFKRFIPALATITLALFSDSRAGLLIIFVQIIVFAILLIRKKKHHKLFIRILKLTTVIVLLIGVFKGKEITTYLIEKANSFDLADGQHSISNRSRFGIQYANYLVFLENPLIGVGYGQQAYEAKSKYPNWAAVNNWEFRLKYLNQSDSKFPPGYNLYTRILAEGGIIGMIFFLALVALILMTCYAIIKKNDDRYILAIVILISIIGFLFNWLKMDTIRVFGFWINLAILIKLTSNGTKFIFNNNKK